MYIVLSELICYMDSYGHAYLDTNTCRCFFETEGAAHKDSATLLPIPKMDERVMVDLFIQKIEYPRLAKRLKKTAGDLHAFHQCLNNLTLYDQWIDFRTSCLLEFAADWCKRNGLPFSRK